MSYDEYEGWNEMIKEARHRRTRKGNDRVHQCMEYFPKKKITCEKVMENVVLVGGSIYLYTTAIKYRYKGTQEYIFPKLGIKRTMTLLSKILNKQL